jgi:hypothetical protein
VNFVFVIVVDEKSCADWCHRGDGERTRECYGRMLTSTSFPQAGISVGTFASPEKRVEYGSS